MSRLTFVVETTENGETRTETIEATTEVMSAFAYLYTGYCQEPDEPPDTAMMDDICQTILRVAARHP